MFLSSSLDTQPAIAKSLALCFSVFQENVTVYSEARLNKPVDCVLLGVGGCVVY